MPPRFGTLNRLQWVRNKPQRLDGEWVVEPLAEDLHVPPTDLLDLEPLPETLVEIAQHGRDSNRPSRLRARRWGRGSLPMRAPAPDGILDGSE